MIPAYNPSKEYLEQTLKSVLAQDAGPEQMQIEVVDDCSPDVDVAAMVREIAGDRVKVSQTPKNLGLAGCWNTCIERARGEWVHILHQDDLVLPGFYQELCTGMKSGENIGAAFTRHAFIDQDGHLCWLSEINCVNPGVPENWLERLGVMQLIQTPSIVVKRSVYEALGGFRSDLCYTLDWEMWLRIATRYSFWFEPQILAQYRVHQSSETSRLVLTAADTRDIRRMLGMTKSYQEPRLVSKVSRLAHVRYADVAVHNARRMLVLGYAQSAWKQLMEALRFSKAPHMWGQVASFYFLWGRLLGARLKRRLKNSFKTY